MTIQVSASTIPNPEELGLTAASNREDTYLAGLLNQCQALDLQVIDPEIAALLQELRDRATLWVNKLTIPTKRDEEWRFTDLSPLLKVNFQQPQIKVDLAESAIANFILPEAPIRLVFVNGTYAPQLSAVADLPEGLVVSNLAQLPVTHRSKVGQYLAQKEGATEVFTVLNTAALTDAAVVWVAKNTVVEAPIHLLFSPWLMSQRR
jgi:Fe-S cluster assembly protein SufD